eukprot:TRINITY_DN28933_c0_g1_i1.p1 TRINITY_DN28933_c0_g1~~TRINITY_DN28933_c0_g1_i1.p1  ORF type:complete len:228 (+),score=78.53 TRINITY_DN28933_c0_g1_i1:78-686(+)
MALDAAAAAEELLRVGNWSVRRPLHESKVPGGSSLVYVNLLTGAAQSNPPPEVLEELGMDEEEKEAAEASRAPGAKALSPIASARARGDADAAGSGIAGAGASAARPPSVESDSAARFRRIVLGCGRDLPLAMARDILAALREDSSIFDVVSKRFSERPAEQELDFEHLPEELRSIAAVLGTGDVSDVIGTDSGMQILMRVC